MSTETPLVATIAYLRFPLRAEHRGGLCDGSICPHCDCGRIQRWGRFAGRQRFRCRGCRRTFSTFTGTPLRYLKHVERWRTFLWCMEGRFTVRRSGAVLGADKNTALRWRHRVLDHWRLEPQRRLRGSVAIGEFAMPLNQKGRRLGRQARRHGHAPGRATAGLQRIGLIAAIETDPDAVPHRSVGCAGAERSDYQRLLGRRIGENVREIIGGGGRLSALAWFAGSVGVAYRMERGGARGESVYRLRRELRRWLRPFRGVASHRLDNYLEWFRRDEAGSPSRNGRPGSPTIHADRARWVRGGGGLPAAPDGTARPALPASGTSPRASP